jgi:hypothetical protein
VSGSEPSLPSSNLPEDLSASQPPKAAGGSAATPGRRRKEKSLSDAHGKGALRFTLTEELLRSVDAWIARQPRRIGREEAIRAFILSGLRLMGSASSPLARLSSSDQHQKLDAFPMAPHPADPPKGRRKKA